MRGYCNTIKLTGLGSDFSLRSGMLNFDGERKLERSLYVIFFDRVHTAQAINMNYFRG